MCDENESTLGPSYAELEERLEEAKRQRDTLASDLRLMIAPWEVAGGPVALLSGKLRDSEAAREKAERDHAARVEAMECERDESDRRRSDTLELTNELLDDAQRKLVAAESTLAAEREEHERTKRTLAEREAVLRECNAVCLCGCPASEHESYGEDGESCGHYYHECVRVAPAVLAAMQTERARAERLAEAAKAAVNGIVEKYERAIPRSSFEKARLRVAREVSNGCSSRLLTVLSALSAQAGAKTTEAEQELHRIDDLLDRRLTLDGLTRVQKIGLALKVCEETDPKGEIARKYVVSTRAALAPEDEVDRG